MARASASSRAATPRRLPRGRHALAPEEVSRDQRERLIAAVAGVVAKRGYEAMSVADVVKAAAVSRNAFYENFSDKRECFAIAHEAGHERLFEVLTGPCETGGTVEERVGGSLTAALAALAGEPALARMLFVEAPAGGEEIALRYHEWLGRYGKLLRTAAAGLSPDAVPPAELEPVIAGGIASRIGGEILHGRAAHLPELIAPVVDYVLAFYAPADAVSPSASAARTAKPAAARSQKRTAA
jgi:AcrR family transcriptional regulator